jgi:hypothetical protein
LSGSEHCALSVPVASSGVRLDILPELSSIEILENLEYAFLALLT